MGKGQHKGTWVRALFTWRDNIRFLSIKSLRGWKHLLRGGCWRRLLRAVFNVADSIVYVVSETIILGGVRSKGIRSPSPSVLTPVGAYALITP